jgi:hypothetical protein
MTMSQLTQQEIDAGFIPLPETGRLMTKEQFRDSVRMDAIKEDAGIAFYATERGMSRMQALFGNFIVADGEDPDRFFKCIPEQVTHVVWFTNGEISQVTQR